MEVSLAHASITVDDNPSPTIDDLLTELTLSGTPSHSRQMIQCYPRQLSWLHIRYTRSVQPTHHMHPPVWTIHWCSTLIYCSSYLPLTDCLKRPPTLGHSSQCCKVETEQSSRGALWPRAIISAHRGGTVTQSYKSSTQGGTVTQSYYISTRTQEVGERPALQTSQNQGMVVNEERDDLSSSTPSSSGTP